MLENTSSILRTMLSEVQPGSEPVTLSGVSSVDFEQLLTFLYPLCVGKSIAYENSNILTLSIELPRLTLYQNRGTSISGPLFYAWQLCGRCPKSER